MQSKRPAIVWIDLPRTQSKFMMSLHHRIKNLDTVRDAKLYRFEAHGLGMSGDVHDREVRKQTNLSNSDSLIRQLQTEVASGQIDSLVIVIPPIIPFLCTPSYPFAYELEYSTGTPKLYRLLTRLATTIRTIYTMVAMGGNTQLPTLILDMNAQYSSRNTLSNLYQFWKKYESMMFTLWNQISHDCHGTSIASLYHCEIPHIAENPEFTNCALLDRAYRELAMTGSCSVVEFEHPNGIATPVEHTLFVSPEELVLDGVQDAYQLWRSDLEYDKTHLLDCPRGFSFPVYMNRSMDGILCLPEGLINRVTKPLTKLTYNQNPYLNFEGLGHDNFGNACPDHSKTEDLHFEMNWSLTAKAVCDTIDRYKTELEGDANP
jgi:hypothetical protein